MMPVIRISNSTFSRLQSHAKPLQDTADDVVSRALDALEKRAVASVKLSTKQKTRNRGDITPQRAFRDPLIKVLADLGGGGNLAQIRTKLAKIMESSLKSDDYKLVSTGEERWWNATCWERSDLVKEGLLRNDSPRGIWELSEVGWLHSTNLGSQ